MNGDLRDKREIVRAEAAITGLAAAKNTAPAARSRDKKDILKIEYKEQPAREEETYRIFAAFLHYGPSRRRFALPTEP